MIWLRKRLELEGEYVCGRSGRSFFFAKTRNAKIDRAKSWEQFEQRDIIRANTGK
jgi:hypothetical protein